MTDPPEATCSSGELVVGSTRPARGGTPRLKDPTREPNPPQQVQRGRKVPGSPGGDPRRVDVRDGSRGGQREPTLPEAVWPRSRGWSHRHGPSVKRVTNLRNRRRKKRLNLLKPPLRKEEVDSTGTTSSTVPQNLPRLSAGVGVPTSWVHQTEQKTPRRLSQGR